MKHCLYLLTACFFMALTTYAQLQPVVYKDGTQQLKGFATAPSRSLSGKPGILILPAWMGIDEHSKTVAAQLSAAGYYAFIADIYGADKQPHNPKEAGELSGYFKQHTDQYQERIRLALKELIRQGADPSHIVVIGYCFGGLGAIEAARINLPVKGIVSFHGAYGRDPQRNIDPIHPAMLILHGADDPHSSADDIKKLTDELNTAHADWQMVYYAHAVHAFTDPAAGNDNSKGAAYNETADKRSWQAMMQFLKEILQP